jgi:pimeloyl-ACP methyl ester carboxylesterase
MHRFLFALLLGAVSPLWAQVGAAPLTPCRLSGVETDALCGSIKRPLDPAAPAGTSIELHFAVLPALARNKHPDPVFFLAGGPGQSAIEIAGTVSRLLQRVSNRRDIVLVDQRGTGRSAALPCARDAPTTSLRESIDIRRQEARLAACREALRKLPHGDLRHYTTTLAMQDLDAVRQALGAERINLVGASYGTRAALEYMRQFPTRLRRVVIDGVAPPDMVLPTAFSVDNQAALDAVFQACAGDAACHRRYPALRKAWAALLQALPREVTLKHPVTGERETLLLTREALLGMVRQPLYMPALASALPMAVAEASQGRFDALLALGLSLPIGRQPPAAGMHFSVVCAEDLPRMRMKAQTPAQAPGADFGDSFAAYYQRVCADWPRGDVPADFYTLPASAVATLVLSGGADPVTPPRHGQRVALALGAQARHVVVPHAGHGVMGIGCMRDVLFRFIAAADDKAALAVDASCATKVPRPPPFLLPQAEGAR